MALLPFHGILGEEEEVLKKKEKRSQMYVHLSTRIYARESLGQLSSVLYSWLLGLLRISLLVWTKGPSIQFLRPAVKLIPRKE